eukprot:15441877-Alexandrium_andersonii.AAC.1
MPRQDEVGVQTGPIARGVAEGLVPPMCACYEGPAGSLRHLPSAFAVVQVRRSWQFREEADHYC